MTNSNKILSDDIFVPISSNYDAPNYKMDHKNRGTALIINMMFFHGDKEGVKRRHGSQFDVDRLEKVLGKKFKFQTKTLHSPTKKELSDVINGGEF